MEKDGLKTASKMMKALVLGEDGSRTIQDVPIPKPRDGQVLVKILAAPINPSDVAFLKGAYSSEKTKPCIPGFEGSGIVVENGGGLIGWSMMNKRVAVAVQNSFNGTYAQYAIASSQEIMPIPSELSFEQASMSFVNPLTVIVMLNKVKAANVKAVVHTAAASSLGRMMNRLFASEGISVINVVRRDEQVELLKKEGAKIVLNSQKQGFQEELAKIAKQLNATLCYDAVSGPVAIKILRALPKKSTLEIYGAMALQFTLSPVELREIIFNHKIIKGFQLATELKEIGLFGKLKLVKKLLNLLSHDLKSVISNEIPLDKFEQGLEYYMNNMTQGKIILKPWLDDEEATVVKESKEEKKQEENQDKKEAKGAQKANEESVEPPKIKETVEKSPEEPVPKSETPTSEETKDAA